MLFFAVLDESRQGSVVRAPCWIRTSAEARLWEFEGLAGACPAVWIRVGSNWSPALLAGTSAVMCVFLDRLEFDPLQIREHCGLLQASAAHQFASFSSTSSQPIVFQQPPAYMFKYDLSPA